MTKFRKQHEKHEKFYSCNGDRYQEEYELYIDELGREELRQCGKKDLHEEIQSYAESVKIDNIIARYVAGDPDALNAVKGFYADVSGMKMSFNEVLNASLTGQRMFDNLPVDVKKKYNNNYVEFLMDPTKAFVDNAVENVEKDVDNKISDEVKNEQEQ